MNIADYIVKAAKDECHHFLSEQNGVLAVVIASVDGFDLASSITGTLDASRIAAMSSSIAAIGSVVTQEVHIGASKSVTVNTENGFVYITYLELAGVSQVLNVIADKSAVLAQVIYRCNEIGKRLKNI
jgi:predicted regulator of Ras-like GTPase activity (Roadblock/LC7/MglB family)